MIPRLCLLAIVGLQVGCAESPQDVAFTQLGGTWVSDQTFQSSRDQGAHAIRLTLNGTYCGLVTQVCVLGGSGQLGNRNLEVAVETFDPRDQYVLIRLRNGLDGRATITGSLDEDGVIRGQIEGLIGVQCDCPGPEYEFIRALISLSRE